MVNKNCVCVCVYVCVCVCVCVSVTAVSQELESCIIIHKTHGFHTTWYMYVLFKMLYVNTCIGIYAG